MLLRNLWQKAARWNDYESAEWVKLEKQFEELQLIAGLLASNAHKPLCLKAGCTFCAAKKVLDFSQET